MLAGRDGWKVEALFTVGDSVGGYTPPGILDGLAAFDDGDGTVDLFVNHELGRDNGYPYTAGGVTLTGARVSRLTIDAATRRVTGARLAFDRIFDRRGRPVDEAGQVNEAGSSTAGFHHFCSSQGYAAGEHGFADDLVFVAEEASSRSGHPHGGTMWVIERESGDLWALPDLGRGAWENVTALDTGDDATVAVLLGDDSAAAGAPLYLYVGTKRPGGFLERNGLTGGRLFAWAPDGSSEGWAGAGSVMAGHFVEVAARDATAWGRPGYDTAGYLDDVTLQEAAYRGGAFRFSRPEDLATDPADGTRAVLASTGNFAALGRDNWGTVYLVDVEFGAEATINATLTILSDGEEEGDFGIRNPDNVEWAADGLIYLTEDPATGDPEAPFGRESGEEASIWSLDPDTLARTRIARIDRSAVLPAGISDGDRTIGRWESSGVLDAAGLFPGPGGTVLLATVQAHTLTDGPIGGAGALVQGGQLLLLWEG
jgi:hypothetical protein